MSHQHQTAHLIRWATQTVWAMEPHAMERYFSILTRAESDPELAASIHEYRAVLLDKGLPLGGTRDVRVRHGAIAVMPMTGPIFRYSDFFTAFSGGATVDSLSRNFMLALNAPQVQAIVLHIDSPGGEITGIQELASHIAAARGIKPIVAYAEGMMCSAAYWIGSAADYIIAGPTALLGSIGVRQLVDTRTREGRIDMVSSQSPDKALDANTEDGRSKLQATLDELCAVFIADVAQYRGVSTETVLADFGHGGVLVGQAAVAAGLADGMNTLEGVIAGLVRQSRRTLYQGGPMDPTLEDLLNKPPANASATAALTTADQATQNTPPAQNTQAAQAAEQQRLAAENEQLKQRIAAIEDSQKKEAQNLRAQAITAAAEAHIAAGRFDPEHRAALEGVYDAVYGTPHQAQLDTLLTGVAVQSDGEQVATTPVTLDRKSEDDYATAASSQVAAYNKATGVKRQ